MGIAGYLFCGAEVKSNVLLSLDATQPIVQISQLAMAFVTITSFPLVLWPVSESISRLVTPALEGPDAVWRSWSIFRNAKPYQGPSGVPHSRAEAIQAAVVAAEDMTAAQALEHATAAEAILDDTAEASGQLTRDRAPSFVARARAASTAALRKVGSSISMRGPSQSFLGLHNASSAELAALSAAGARASFELTDPTEDITHALDPTDVTVAAVVDRDIPFVQPSHPHLQRCCINLVFGLVLLYVAISFTDILDVFNIVGSTLGVAFSYFLPGLFYHKLVDAEALAPKAFCWASPIITVVALYSSFA
eukprot:gnl/Ergobibamus_cyprinoides/1676.p1 GENE.gnl/Ergobibamus_cyprinoides/1676~~gnl/Ergobibamus_cyprinoides/1676.p1  ORF type:complete len:307 (+),score=106.19 gnl/Ergobibamus_cyprinoides/1676:393-1313(+)